MAHALLGFMLLSLHLKCAWPWPIKAIAIGTALPLFVTTFAALHMLMGWPSDADLPETFELHAALVDEPAAGKDQVGAIYLWLTPSAAARADVTADGGSAVDGELIEAGSAPRAFVLPYSRDLHNRVEAMRDALLKGKRVAGRHAPGSSWERRFGQHHGGIELYAPPPPPLPSKDG